MYTKKQLEKTMPTKSNVYADSVMWSKRGGHAGDKMILKSIIRFKTIGFKERSFDANARPDGAYVRNSSVLEDMFGNLVQYGSSYGCEARDNYYYITLTFSQKYLDMLAKVV